MKKKQKEEKKFLKLNYKQELFCRYFIETCGNKTKSALLAFDIKNRDLAIRMIENEKLNEEEKKEATNAYFCASVMGSEYFEKPHIKKRIEELIENEYFTDGVAKREHVKILLQDKDLSTKKGAIEMYYKLKGKFAPEKQEVTHSIDIPNYKDLSIEDLRKLETEVMKQLK